METLFFTVVVLFFLGIAVYYVFQKSKQGSLLPKKKQRPEIISPEPQLYAGSDSAPTLQEALEEIEEESSFADEGSLADNRFPNHGQAGAEADLNRDLGSGLLDSDLEEGLDKDEETEADRKAEQKF